MKKFRDCTEEEVSKYCNKIFYGSGSCLECPLKKGICIKMIDKEYLSEKALNIELPIKNKILDDAEKRYLSAVIKPFRNRVKYISKETGHKEYIDIELDNDACLLPYLEKNTMYKGMEVGKRYTLEELGLFEED